MKYNSIVFGDSHVTMFYLIENKNFTVNKYVGSSIKGILSQNHNYYDIIEKTNKKKHYYGFFMFGFVDVYFYYYYRKYAKMENNNSFDFILSYIPDYVKFIHSLKKIKHKFIFSIIPNNVEPSHYLASLRFYNILNDHQLETVYSTDYSAEILFERAVLFNSKLEKYCEKYNIKFINFYADLFYNNKVYPLFHIVYSKINVHLIYEYVLLYLLQTYLYFIKKLYNFPKLIENAEIYYNNYLYIRLEKLRKLSLYNDNVFNYQKLNNFISKKFNNQKILYVDYK